MKRRCIDCKRPAKYEGTLCRVCKRALAERTVRKCPSERRPALATPERIAFLQARAALGLPLFGRRDDS
jgi:predicted amidophosphoribosyltransferase